MNNRGGKRERAGNKAGSIRPKITHYWSQKDIEDYFVFLKKEYKNSPTLAKFVGEYLMGKAVQPISNDGDEVFKIEANVIKFIK
jgi:hypothetical protein